MKKISLLIPCFTSTITCFAMHTYQHSIANNTVQLRKELGQKKRIETRKARQEDTIFAQLTRKKEHTILPQEQLAQALQLPQAIVQHVIPLCQHAYARHSTLNTVASLLFVAGLVAQTALAHEIGNTDTCFANECFTDQRQIAQLAEAHISQSPLPAVDNLWKSQLYSPWRNSYKKPDSSSTQAHECPFCSHLADSHDKNNFILKRTENFAVLLNLYPYNPGHLMIIPLAHIKDFEGLSASARSELIDLQIECINVLKKVLHTEDFNIGINMGKHAGASIPDHLHIHIVPRYEHEGRAFIHTIAQTNVIQVNLENLYEKLKAFFE